MPDFLFRVRVVDRVLPYSSHRRLGHVSLSIEECQECLDVDEEQLRAIVEEAGKLLYDLLEKYQPKRGYHWDEEGFQRLLIGEARSD